MNARQFAQGIAEVNGNNFYHDREIRIHEEHEEDPDPFYRHKRCSCPMWTGSPLYVHWGVDDPATCAGSEADKRAATERAWRELDYKIEQLVKLDIEALTPTALQIELDRIAPLWPET